MAGEIAHVVYGARLLTYLSEQVRDQSYWAGLLFPDIRHLGVVSRHRTHPDAVTLASLKGKDDFHTGMRVHAWTDVTREKFLHQQHTKENLPWHPFVPHALKLLEDEVVYDHFEDWKIVRRVLDKTHTEELFYVEDQSAIQQWHTILQNYLKSRPTDQTRRELMMAIGLSANSADEVNSVVTRLRDDKRALHLIDELHGHLERLL